MISSVSQGTAFPPPGGPRSTESLTTDQLDGLNELLSSYDPSSTSEADAQAIVEGVKELGITPGAALESAMADAGFDARAIGDQAGVGGPPPRGGASGMESSETLSALSELLAEKDMTDMSESDWADIVSQLEALGFATDGSLFDIRV